MRALMLMVLLSTAAGAQQPDPNQYLKNPVPHPAHPAFPGSDKPVFHTDDGSHVAPLSSFETPATFTVENSACQKVDCFIMFNDNHGNEIVRINQRTGQVIVHHPERQDAAARQFWLSLTRAFHQLHCSPP